MTERDHILAKIAHLADHLALMGDNDMGWLSLAEAKRFHKAVELLKSIERDRKELTR